MVGRHSTRIQAHTHKPPLALDQQHTHHTTQYVTPKGRVADKVPSVMGTGCHGSSCSHSHQTTSIHQCVARPEVYAAAALDSKLPSKPPTVRPWCCQSDCLRHCPCVACNPTSCKKRSWAASQAMLAHDTGLPPGRTLAAGRGGITPV